MATKDNPYYKKFRQPRKLLSATVIKTMLEVAKQALETECEMVATWKPKIGKDLPFIDRFILGSDKTLIQATPEHAVLMAQARIDYISEKIDFLNQKNNN